MEFVIVVPWKSAQYTDKKTLANSVPCQIRQEMLKYNKVLVKNIKNDSIYKGEFDLIKQDEQEKVNDNQELSVR